MKTVSVILSLLSFYCAIESSRTVEDDKETTDKTRTKGLKEESKDSLKHFLEKYPSGPESFRDVIDQTNANPANDDTGVFQSYDDFSYESYDVEINYNNQDGQKSNNTIESSSKKNDFKISEKLVDSVRADELISSETNAKTENNGSEKMKIIKTKDKNIFFEAPEKFRIRLQEDHSIAKKDQYDNPYDYESFSSVDADRKTNTEDTVDSSNKYRHDEDVPEISNVGFPDRINSVNSQVASHATPADIDINNIPSAGINSTANLTRINAFNSMELNAPEKSNMFAPEKFSIDSMEILTPGIHEHNHGTAETITDNNEEEKFNFKTKSSIKENINFQAPENFRVSVTKVPESFQLEPSYPEHMSRGDTTPVISFSDQSFLQKSEHKKAASAGINLKDDDDEAYVNKHDQISIEVNEEDQVGLSKTSEYQINDSQREKIKIKPFQSQPLPDSIPISERKKEIHKHIQGQPTLNPIPRTEDVPHQLKHEIKIDDIEAFQSRHPYNPYPYAEKVPEKIEPGVYDSLKFIFSDPKRFFGLINSNENLRAAFKIAEYDMGSEGQWLAGIPESLIRDSRDDANYTDMWLKILKTIYHIIKTKSVLEGTETTDIILNDLLEFLEDIESYVEHFHEEIECPKFYYRVGNLCLALDFLDSYLDFHEARLFCQIVKGGDLVIFRDANEFAYIQFFLRKIDPSKEFSYWVGLTDEENEGDWRFIDGRTAHYGSPFWGVKKLYCPNCKNPNPLLIDEPHDDESYPYQRILQPEIMNKHENYAVLMKTDYHYIHDVSTQLAEKCNTIPLCQYIPERDAIGNEGPDIWNELITRHGNQPYDP